MRWESLYTTANNNAIYKMLFNKTQSTVQWKGINKQTIYIHLIFNLLHTFKFKQLTKHTKVHEKKTVCMCEA